jgi:hypothetical protein
VSVGEREYTRWNFWTRFGRESAIRRIETGDVEEKATFRVVDLPLLEIISAASPPVASSVRPRSSQRPILRPTPDATVQRTRHIAHNQQPTHYIDVNKSRLVFHPVQPKHTSPRAFKNPTRLPRPRIFPPFHKLSTLHHYHPTPPNTNQLHHHGTSRIPTSPPLTLTYHTSSPSSYFRTPLIPRSPRSPPSLPRPPPRRPPRPPPPPPRLPPRPRRPPPSRRVARRSRRRGSSPTPRTSTRSSSRSTPTPVSRE